MKMFAALVVCGVITMSVVQRVRADELDPGWGGPTAAPIVVPPGLYLVTDVYAGSVVVTSGGTTTYSTVTVRATPGTYARVLDAVGTGVASAYDGRSFNGRGRLTDGRLIAGTYYQTFVLTTSGFVPVNIVFFQDDSETRTLVAPTLTPMTVAPSTPRASPAVAPVATPVRTPFATAFVPAPTMPPMPVVAAGVSLASDGPTLASIEVLRGRAVELWPRAFVDGVAVPVRSWRLLSSQAGIARSNGTGAQPAEAVWLSPTVSPLDVRFEVFSDAAPGRALVAVVSVLVRSPALAQ